jgi:hypothetical protein
MLGVACRTYLVVFATPQHAKHFVQRLILYMTDVSAFRDGESVLIFDATKHGAQGRIAELARSSSATSIRAVKS